MATYRIHVINGVFDHVTGDMAEAIARAKELVGWEPMTIEGRAITDTLDDLNRHWGVAIEVVENGD